MRPRHSVRTLRDYSTKKRYIFGNDDGDKAVVVIIEPISDSTVQDSINNKTRDRKAIPSVILWRIIIDFFRGLANLHARGLRHRDIKRDSLGYSERDGGQGTVLDLGLIVELTEDDNATTGTSLYAAPEIMYRLRKKMHGNIKAQCRPAADVYAAGWASMELLIEDVMEEKLWLREDGMPGITKDALKDVCGELIRLSNEKRESGDLLCAGLCTAVCCALIESPKSRHTAAEMVRLLEDLKEKNKGTFE
jgi:serine/threonine protein kinase